MWIFFTPHATNLAPSDLGQSSAVRALGDVESTPESEHNVSMKVQVECYSGHKEGERPVRFRMGEHEYLVEEVVDQWYGPEHVFFKVHANDGNLYILRRETSAPDGAWELVSFRHAT